MKILHHKKGAVLLIAILMASVMLTVGLGVYQRTYKEIYFASFWKQTQRAFSRADIGLECALYRDLHPPTAPAPAGSVWFATSTPPVPVPPSSFNCGGGSVSTSLSPSISSNGYMYATTTFPSIGFSQGFKVEVVKITNITVGTTTTKIISRGYNASYLSGSRVVERGLKIEY